MNVILILRIFLTAAGVLFLLGDINAYVRQKLTDTIGLLWAFVSVALILTGVVSVPGQGRRNTWWCFFWQSACCF